MFEHFGDTLRTLAVPSLALACAISLTNLGLSLSSIEVHSILRCSEMGLLLLLSHAFSDANNKPSMRAAMAALLTAGGVLLYALTAFGSEQLSVAALTVNLAAACFGPVQMVWLKRATNRLLETGRLTVLQLTALKLAMASVFVMPAMLAMDGSNSWAHLRKDFNGLKCTLPVLFIGSVLTLCFQGTAVTLTHVSTPVLVGILQQTIPIWTYFASLLLSDTRLLVCGCHPHNEHNSGHCHSKRVRFPQCPCFQHPLTALGFSNALRTLHSTAVALVVAGVFYYAYLKYHKLHVAQ